MSLRTKINVGLMRIRWCSPSTSLVHTRPFHISSRNRIQIGDPIPDVPLMESSPGNKISLAEQFGQGGRGVIVGIPAAFSPSCSATHIPGYINSPSLRSAGQVFVVSVNDPFVMKAFRETLDPNGSSGVSVSVECIS